MKDMKKRLLIQACRSKQNMNFTIYFIVKKKMNC